ncbi:hypothetical protein CO2235_U600116 [Cupriavidus oxalaticus]|uniref:Uncharacterized protein n=1 Tax=Cupriavidus oxalaticus TaxID=96344 RepID=A0A375FNH0_9BURK|nr:hypothetical protein CO2235_U600116 [Cupriavidus oxalaticus]
MPMRNGNVPLHPAAKDRMTRGGSMRRRRTNDIPVAADQKSLFGGAISPDQAGFCLPL